MKITLSQAEAKEILFLALCNGGLQELACASVELNVSKEEYTKAKARLLKEGKKEGSLCYEDVLLEIINAGNALKFYDHESEEEVSFTLEQAVENMQEEGCVQHILTYKNEEDDAWTAFGVLQYALYKEEIYC